MAKDNVSRKLSYGGSRQPVPKLVGLTADSALAASARAGVPVVAAGPGDDPRPLLAEHGMVVRQHPEAGRPLGVCHWVMVWTEQNGASEQEAPRGEGSE
ncbi:PASTA domain-containing protein [Amycolatopsis cynarae]|uniref:PASTA domain-containing protein n=1 Tax=Amycolatopsis cynarae TaxID=2995223 RepID=A0ABY7B4H7_9PSEU|nr:PASTA domain-containing protein [Amycolatopsis sp. HUAS 11-8]WAL66142.1 PASTA domain-containing protein [Amycolatopsis sp. HUAS 11-8]